MTLSNQSKLINLAIVFLTCLIGFDAAGRNAEKVSARVEPHISHGPILGRLGPDRIAVWARTSRPANFFVRYGTAPDLMTETSGVVITTLARDNTAQVMLTSLKPGTRYYYQLVLADFPHITSEIFSFSTLPSAQQHLGELNPNGLFNFAFSATSCAKQSATLSQGRAQHRTLVTQAARDVSFHVALGDWLYEKDRMHSTQEWLTDSGDPGSTIPKTVLDAPALPGAWENYKHYLQNDADLSQWHASVPSMFVFDDHEVLNNFQDATVVGHRARNALFRDPGLRAWRDYLGWANPEQDDSTVVFGRGSISAGNATLYDPDTDFRDINPGGEKNLHVHWGGPYAGHRNTDALNRSAIDAQIDSTGPVDPNAGVYRVEKVIDRNTVLLSPKPKLDSESAYSIGGLRYFFGWKVANAEVIGLDTRSRRRSTLASSDTSMLGDEQWRWLESQIHASSAELIILLSSVSITIPHVSGAPPNVDDQSWSGYPQDRSRLIDLLEASGKTVIILTGDLHNAYSIQLSSNIWEFAVGPIGALNRTVKNDQAHLVGANGVMRQGSFNADIRWGTWFHKETPPRLRRTPVYTIVQVNNVIDSPGEDGSTRWVAYERPQVVVQFFHAVTGKLLYAESVLVRPSGKE
ncbi:MAG: alkaline phosphatase D family protein [Xanthomonadales bacterium]|nr:alkaline phosphatase D family protein [Xanthomonadales bacterium]